MRFLWYPSQWLMENRYKFRKMAMKNDCEKSVKMFLAYQAKFIHDLT